MGKYCLIADDQKSADLLFNEIKTELINKDILGIALFPEALSAFEKNGIEAILMDNFISKTEHENAALSVSDFVLNINGKLNSDQNQKDIPEIKSHDIQ